MRRAQRGYVLLLVLVLVLVLTLLATRLVQTSYFDTYAMTATQLQGQAVINSTMGVQEGLARLRSGAVLPGTLPLCATAASCNPLPAPLKYVDNTDATHSRYTVTLFIRPRVRDATVQFSGPSTTMVVVSSEGYAYTACATCTTNTAFSTLTEVEVALPSNTGGTAGSGDPVGNTFAGGG